MKEKSKPKKKSILVGFKGEEEGVYCFDSPEQLTDYLRKCPTKIMDYISVDSPGIEKFTKLQSCINKDGTPHLVMLKMGSEGDHPFFSTSLDKKNYRLEISESHDIQYLLIHVLDEICQGAV